MMTKSDFVAIAEVLAEHKDSDTTYYIAMDLSDVFYSINQNFSHELFMQAIDFEAVVHSTSIIFEEDK